MKARLLLFMCCVGFMACQGDAPTASEIDPADTEATPELAKSPDPGADSAASDQLQPQAGHFTRMPAHHADRPSALELLPGIDITRNHRITGPRGETILIPANSLMDAQGNTVHGTVQVAWSAALTMVELHDMRAPTVCDGQLLGSGGSIYLEAEQDGQLLRIKEGMDWKVTVPSEPVTLFPKATMKVFTGQRRRGTVDWSLDPVERIETVPLNYKYFSILQNEMPGRDAFARVDSLARRYPVRENNSVVAPQAELAIGRDKARIAALVLPFYTDARFRNTYVCSPPFLARLKVLTEHIFSVKRSMGDVYFIDERMGANQYIIDILTLYRDHADGPMRVPDAMAHALLAKLDAINPGTPSTSAIHMRKLRAAYKEFLAQDLGLPIVIDDHGVDLDAADAYDQLVRAGLTLEAASKILEEANDRRNCIDGLKQVNIVEPVDDGSVTESWTKNLPDGRQAVVRKRQTYTVRFSGGFGYINCDRFIGPEFAAPSNIFVTLDGPELSYERVSMFFPSVNGVVELQRDADARTYRLPSNFTRLPHGQPMAMLVVGKNAEGYAYHLVKGTVSANVNLRLKPRNGDMEELAARLAEL
jgi:hypothetical protein